MTPTRTPTSGHTRVPAFVLVSLLVAGLAGPAAAQRSHDGSGNNATNPDWGSTGEQLLRLAPSAYDDGIDMMSGGTRPNPREISNAVAAQSGDMPNASGLSDMFWVWGQFVDHDIDLTRAADPAEPYPIPVAGPDPLAPMLPFNRSVYDPMTGTDVSNPREQINEITAFLDGSVIYGSDSTRALALREDDGSGRLKMSSGGLLMFNTLGLDNANDGPLPDDEMFLSGDVRANENIALSSMHTIFVREHNRIADEIKAANPGFFEDDIYDAARTKVTAQLQAITYNEFLPVLLGGALPDYAGYDDTVNPGIANEFSTAAYRFGHTMLGNTLERRDAAGNEAPEGHIPLAHAFFNPAELVDNGIDSILRGAAGNRAQEIDPLVVDAVRNFLFGAPGMGGMDLASLNLQRGRDHGLPGYNEVRDWLGLGAVLDFDEITSDAIVQDALSSVYASVDEIDLWVGGLAEDPDGTSLLGETFSLIVLDQFLRLRDGDSFWYELLFSGAELDALNALRLGDVIERNSNVDLHDSVYFTPEPGTGVLVSLGMLVLAARRRRVRKANVA